MSTADMAVAAMAAGLRHEKMPDLKTKLTREQLELVNRVYDEARNWRAGQLIRSRGYKHRRGCPGPTRPLP